ncbi:MAG: hypothetical protein ABEL04_04935 [Salinibacter sp.]|uniref:hypothetical protein n=1 Tax=Salinibacter sp. TaxID=2065818 RepID=UPI0035D5190B
MASPVKITVAGLTAVVPKSIADREDGEEAVEALLRAAGPHYNDAVRSVRSEQIPEALQQVRTALRLCPYCIQFVDFGLALAIRHGDFELAKRLLTWAREAEIYAELPDYESALDRSVSDWNRFLNDTSALRKKYQSPDPSASYRELLLLSERAGTELKEPLSQQERSFLEEHGIPLPDEEVSSGSQVTQRSSWQKQVAVVGVAGLVGLAVGIGIYDAYIGEKTRSTKVEALTAEIDSLQKRTRQVESIFRRTGRANLYLARGKPLAANKAWATTGSISDAAEIEVAKKSVRRAIDQGLYAAGISAWESEDFRKVVELLTEISSDTVGSEIEHRYMLGISAHQVGESEIAEENLQKLLKIKTLGEEYPHYEAQAAYALVQLLSGTEAQRYANLIAEKYSDTLYYNSTVRSYISSS